MLPSIFQNVPKKILVLVIALHSISDAKTPVHDFDIQKVPPTLKMEEGRAEFSSKLYRQVANNNEGNLVISPLSVYIVLAMLRVGAKNQCKKQMENVLGLSDTNNIDFELKTFAQSLFEANGTLSIASKAWQQSWFCFTACRRFTKKIQNIFQAELGEVNFFANSDVAAKAINRWAYVKSRGRIEKLVPKEQLDWNTRLVLTNVVFFKSGWKQIFLMKYTRKLHFTALVDGVQKRKYVPTMLTNGQFRSTHGYGADYRAIELPYKDENFSMVIVMPHTTNDFSRFEMSLTSKKISQVVEHLRHHPKTDVLLTLPKFRISVGFTLNDALKAMGMTDIFSRNFADLSNLHGFKGMFVSQVKHEAMISIDEFGTEAAGGSSVSVGDLALSDFRVNRPFLFFIRHVPTESIVFMGKVVDPSL